MHPLSKEDESSDIQTPQLYNLLNDKISQIGMGRYQINLFVLCGAGNISLFLF